MLPPADKDQRASDVEMWMARYEMGIQKMHEWNATMGNTEGSTVFDATKVRMAAWPDQYMRGFTA